MSIGDFLESMSQPTLVGIMLVGKLSIRISPPLGFRQARKYNPRCVLTLVHKCRNLSKFQLTRLTNNSGNIDSGNPILNRDFSILSHPRVDFQHIVVH